jgi:hypothetical protein
MSQSITNKILLACTLLFSSLLINNPQAALIERAGGLVYDDILDVTWMANLNFHEENIDQTGWTPTRPSSPWRNTNGVYRTNYQDVHEWVEQLTFAGSSNWRLPTVSPVNGISFETGVSNGFYLGETDIGYGITSEASELAHLINFTLGNQGELTSSGYAPGTMTNEGPFEGLFSNFAYWTQISSFNITRTGEQVQNNWYTFEDEGIDGVLILADGDIGVPVPGPSGLILLATGLIGIRLFKNQTTV